MSNHVKNHITPCQIYDLKEAAQLIAANPRTVHVDLKALYGAQTLTNYPEPLKPSLKQHFKEIRIGNRIFK